jgi:hypothetical protein
LQNCKFSNRFTTLKKSEKCQNSLCLLPSEKFIAKFKISTTFSKKSEFLPDTPQLKIFEEMQKSAQILHSFLLGKIDW